MKSKMVSIDTSLVLPWSEDLILEEPFEYPFRVDYRFSNKHLIYIAALHSCESNSPTFKFINDSVENEKIDLIILEGFEHSLGVSPEPMKNWASMQGIDGKYEGFETAYSISLATSKALPFLGSEPDDLTVLQEVWKQGHKSEDLLFYYFVQQSFQMNEVGSKLAGQPLFEKLINSKRNVFNIEPTYDNFLDWYLKKNGQQFVSSEISDEAPAPYENGELFTQRISSLVCRIRDQFILSTIGNSLNRHDTVLVVCGGSHWSTQKVALETALGAPSFSGHKMTEEL